MSFRTDIAQELKKIGHDPVTLRKFAVVMAGALTVVGAVIFFKDAQPEWAYGFWGAAIGFLGVGLAWPRVLRPVHFLWMALASVLGWWVSRVILALLFYLVMTPIGLLLRMAGRDLLDQKLDRQAASYWIRRQTGPNRREHYERLF